MKKITQSLTTICAIAGMSVSLVGCNTVRGVGQDVEKGGQKLQHVATRTQKQGPSKTSMQGQGKSYRKTTTTYSTTTNSSY